MIVVNDLRNATIIVIPQKANGVYLNSFHSDKKSFAVSIADAVYAICGFDAVKVPTNSIFIFTSID